MDIDIQPENSQKNPNLNGPRVSFNRDVHVKRIGARSSEPRPHVNLTSLNIHPHSNVRKEPPNNLSAAALRREAEFVLSQTDKINRNNQRSRSSSKDKFNSLPSRKSRAKPLIRSVSDASSKKNQIKSNNKHSEPTPERNGVTRSKSDAGSSKDLKEKKPLKKYSDDIVKHLTPIIETSPLEYNQPLEPLSHYNPTGNIGFTNQKDLDIFPSKPASKSVMDTITILSSHTKSQDKLHSSQLPQEKPHLTKGVTVDSIVKRLSTERFSPPPAQVVSGGFSYTRPKEQIVYAQVVCNNDGKEKHTVRNHFQTNHIKDVEKVSTSSQNLLTDMPAFEKKEKHSSPLYDFRSDELDNMTKIRTKHYNSDEDEGLGFDDTKKYNASILKHTERTSSDDDPITPKIKFIAPEKPYTTSYSVNYRGQGDGKEFFPEFSELSQRRAILESRIKSRIGSRELLDQPSPDRDIIVNKYQTALTKNYQTKAANVDIRDSYSPVRRTASPVIVDDTTRQKNAKNKYVETFVTKTVVSRDGKPQTTELTERYKYPGEPEKVRTSRTTHVPEFNVAVKEHKYDRKFSSNTKQLRNMDKGDSGIENDFRKDSFNNDLPNRKKYSLSQNIQSCENFIRHERQHTNDNLRRFRKTYSYRERSIDDGSRYDPRLDTSSSHRYQNGRKSTLKQEKKSGGLAKVKQFMNSTKKKFVKISGDNDRRENKRGFVHEDEMRARYREYGGHAVESKYLKTPDIAHRRRLSTPKSSPTSAKRSLSFKSSKISSTMTPTDQKSSKGDWFKSFDRLSKKKSGSKPQIDKPIEKPSKSLRFFGDTDNEYVEKVPYRPSRNNLTKIDKKYQSAYDLDILPKISEDKNRSSSMHNLEQENNMNEPNKRVLYEISEHQNTLKRRDQTPSPVYPRKYRDYTPDELSNISYSRSRENSRDRASNLQTLSYSRSSRSRTATSRSSEHKKPPSGPQKPARSFERKGSLSRETDRDRIQDSSEGESSQQSQRSIVYLHAATVGDIPHPHIVNTRQKAFSREELNDPKKLQPQTRTISRSISVLAPWKPKHIQEGYEINYNQNDNAAKQTSTLPRSMKTRSSSQSTLSRKRETKSRKNPRDELDSDKSSSFENSRLSYNHGGNTSTLPSRKSKDSTVRSNTLNKYRRN